jgi:predicted nuclease of predicted toxin-antitoxin system
MARLYADENVSYLVVEELRRLGHDVLTAQEAGQGNRRTPDEVILASAVALGRVVLTHNRRHFMRLHLQGATHAGIVVCTRDTDVAALAARIHAALSTTPLLDNQLIRIVRPQRP